MDLYADVTDTLKLGEVSLLIINQEILFPVWGFRVRSCRVDSEAVRDGVCSVKSRFTLFSED